MRKISLLLSFVLISTFVQAQTVKLVGMNTLYGAATGTGLGAATMLLNNSDEFGPLRVGFGAGTLAGLGLGIYDVSAEKGLIQSTFTNSEISGQIIAMDTFYGAGTGAIVGFAIALISNKDIVDGLKVGTGAGAWVGFGFGVVETFFLSSSGGASGYGIGATSTYQDVQGLVQITDAVYSVGFIAPSTVQSLQNGSWSLNPSVTFAHAKVSF